MSAPEVSLVVSPVDTPMAFLRGFGLMGFPVCSSPALALPATTSFSDCWGVEEITSQAKKSLTPGSRRAGCPFGGSCPSWGGKGGFPLSQGCHCIQRRAAERAVWFP